MCRYSRYRRAKRFSKLGPKPSPLLLVPTKRPERVVSSLCPKDDVHDREVSSLRPAEAVVSPTNPYAAPTRPDEDPSAYRQRTASRWRRLAATLIDGLALVVILVVATMVTRLVAASELKLRAPSVPIRNQIASDPSLIPPILAAMLLPALLLYSLQCYLVAKRGQSVAKVWLGIRVVRCDGRPAGFLHGVLLRTWLMGAMMALPVVGWLIGVANILMIFHHRSRCLHDVLADTRVIDVS